MFQPSYIVYCYNVTNNCTNFVKFKVMYANSLGRAVAQLVKALRYKPAGRGFDSRWCHWNFSVT